MKVLKVHKLMRRVLTIMVFSLPILSVYAGVPSVLGITEVSSPAAGGGTYYDAGETISFQVNFSENILVSGTPKLKFESQNLQNEAVYVTGSGTNVAQFDFRVPTGKNDWNGITVNRFEINSSVGEDIESQSTNEDIIEDFTDIDLSGIKIDSSNPVFDRVELSTSDGQVNGGVTYFKSGDKMKAEIFLSQDDTRSASSVDFQIGGVTKTLNFTGSNVNGESNSSQKTTSSSFFDGENGAITITNVSWTDQAGKSFSQALSQSTNFVVDSVVPVFTSIDLSGVAIDGYINDLEKSDTNSVVTNLQALGQDQTRYAIITSATTCNASVNFTTLGTTAPIATDFATDGNYKVCLELSDNAQNPTVYGETSTIIVRDTAAPVFTSIDLSGVATDSYINLSESTDTNAVVTNLQGSDYDQARYAIISSATTCNASVNFSTLGTTPPVATDFSADGNYKVCVELSDNAGNTNAYGESSPIIVRDTEVPAFTSIDLSGVAVDGYINDLEKSDTNSVVTNLQGSGYDQARYAIIDNGNACDNSVDFTILGIVSPIATDFTADKAYQVCVELTDNAGNPVAYGASSAITRDILYPSITSIPLANEAADQYVSAADKVADNTLATLNASGFDHDDFSIVIKDTTCNAIISYGFTNMPTANQITGADGNYEVCTKLADLAGNITYGKSAAFFVQDTIFPSFQSISVASDNPFDSNYAKADSNLTFMLKLQNPETFIGPGAITGKIDFTIGSSSTISVNISEDASDSLSDTYTASYAINGENGAITIQNIVFQDKASQALTGFTSQVPSPTVIVDSTFPNLSAASSITTNANSLWAKAGDRITYTLNYSEDIAQSTTTGSTNITGNVAISHAAQNASKIVQDADLSVYNTTDQIIFEVVNGDNGPIAFQAGQYEIVDRAGNTKAVNHADINALISGVIQADTTNPQINQSKIFSDNSLDISLARSNDTITLDFLPEDNLSPTVTLENASAQILNEPLTNSNISITGSGSIVQRFTDGSEQSETIVPFKFRIQDEAGNYSDFEENVTDNGSTVRFDRTNPLTQKVIISAASQDNSSYLGDLPTYYAKQGDSITLSLQTCDYVDVNNPAPTGNLFGQNVTLSDAGSTTEACTTPQGNNGFWRNWTTTINNIDGVEGVVNFDILVKDNAGNGNGGNLANGNPDNTEIHVTGTTDGSRVIFDKTIPHLPASTITALDREGAETERFKHRLNAEFNWSGAQDDNANTTDIAGIYQYNVRLTNPANGVEEHKKATLDFITNWNATISDHPTYSGQRIPPRDPKYDLNMSITDKAGNTTPEEIIYQQFYTIGLEGTVTDKDGYVLPGVLVQAVARYGDECDTGLEVCTDTTDSQGRYTIVLKKDRTYNVSYIDYHHYMEKTEIYIPFNDVNKDTQLKQIEEERAYQTTTQTITIRTNKKTFPGINNEITFIEVDSLSGEITTVEQDGKIIITSLSRITKVSSNDTEVIISETSPNIFTIENAGSITSSSAKSDIDQNSTFGDPRYKTTKNFSSGESRLGVKLTAGNGKLRFRYPGQKRGEHLVHGKFWTEEESKAFTETFNKGYKGHVKTYQNRNGYHVFAGYQAGRLGVDRYKKRHQNEVRYRGSKNRQFYRASPDQNLVAMHGSSVGENNDSPKKLTEKIAEMKEKYQDNNSDVDSAHQNQKNSKIGYKKTNAEKAALTIISRDRFLEKSSKSSEVFARKREENNTKSRIEKNESGAIQLRFKGKGVGMDKFFP